jgi:hypothetical protein
VKKGEVMSEPTDERAARFWPKVDKRGPDECWPWLGGHISTNPDRAYGQFTTHNKGRPAHVVAWELVNEQPFPQGMRGCHTCDHPWCVNPAHVFPGTARDNALDMLRKGRLAAAVATHCKRGHEYTSETVTRTPRRKCRICVNERQRAYSRRDRAVAS